LRASVWSWKPQPSYTGITGISKIKIITNNFGSYHQSNCLAFLPRECNNRPNLHSTSTWPITAQWIAILKVLCDVLFREKWNMVMLVLMLCTAQVIGACAHTEQYDWHYTSSWDSILY
jgi:hypothetical protein